MDANPPRLEMRRRWYSTGRGRLVLAATAAVAVAAVVAAIAVPLVAMRRMMDTRPLTERALASSAPGGPVELAIEITTAGDGLVVGQMLERSSQTHYRRTQRALKLRWSARTKLVMGKRDDIRPGAVVQAHGPLDAEAVIDADRLVVLTGSVEVD